MSKNKNTFRFIAGIIFAAMAAMVAIRLFYVIRLIYPEKIYVIPFFRSAINPLNDWTGCSLYLYFLISCVLISVGFFLSSKTSLGIGFALASFIAIAYAFPSRLIIDDKGYISWLLKNKKQLRYFIKTVLITLGFFLSFIASLSIKDKTNIAKAKFMGIVSAAFLALGSFLSLRLSMWLDNLIFYSLAAIGLLFAALSLNETPERKPSSAKSAAVFNASVYGTAVSSNTELLMRLESLLDTGAITQEEFDEQKKKISGLW